MHIADTNSNRWDICTQKGKTEEDKKNSLSLFQPLSTQHTVPATLKVKLKKANLPCSGTDAHKHTKQQVSLLITGHHKVHAD